MRPACPRNARSLASVPSPILPFLAPRAYAEAQLVTRQHGNPSQKEQETKKSWNGRRGMLAWDAKERMTLGVRYADIFSFARQQLRNYSTEGASGNTQQTANQVTQQRNEGRVRRSEKAVPRQRVRRVLWIPDSTLPKPLQHLTMPERRRQGRLHLIQKSFKAFQRHESLKFQGTHKKVDGKYRSLRRRIYALSAREPQVVDLQKPLELLERLRRGLSIMAFAALDRKIYPDLERRSHPIVLKHHDMCASWTARLLDNEDASSADRIWTNWNDFDVKTKKQYWAHLLIYLLDKLPHKALPFLQALTHRPCVETLDAAILADAFEHLARVYVRENVWKPAQREHLQQSKSGFIPAFYHVFREHLAPHKRVCSPDLLFCVAKLASVEDLQRIFNLMKDSDAHIDYHVLLHYANTFAEAGDFRHALSCLEIIMKGAKYTKIRAQIVNQEKFRWSCALTLHRSMTNERNYHETTGIVAAFVDFGVKLDILLYNVIIHNAVEAGDYTTAFKVYNTLEENGLKPDKVTFSTLLHGCTKAAEPAKFDDFAKYCAETAREMKDPWLAAGYLYFELLRLRRESQNSEGLLERSEQILRTYLQFFSSRPLEPFWAAGPSLRASPLSSSDNILTESAFMDPPPLALYIMLQLEILKASSPSRNNVWALYQKFTELVQVRHDASLSKLAKDPIIWNAFLLSFCRAQNFEHASQVVYDMAKHGSQPNVYTWNIFMQGFFKSQQIQAAERVYEIMRSRGIEPDQFTYEVLLRGYARAQNVRKIGEVMVHIENEKQVDPKLLRDLARVHDQRRVLYELEKARALREELEEMEGREKEEMERVKWAPPKFAPLVKPKEEPVYGKDSLRIKPLLKPGSASDMSFKSIFKQ